MNTASAINAVINNLSDKIGQAVANLTPAAMSLYALYVKQAIIHGYEMVVVGGLMILVGLGVSIGCWRGLGQDDDEVTIPVGIFFGILPLILGIMILIGGINHLAVPGLMAWHALLADLPTKG